MMYCRVKKRIELSEGKLWGYVLEVVEDKEEIKISFYDAVNAIRKGLLEIENVILTKNNTLRGTNGFHLSKVDTIPLANEDDIIKLYRSLQYVLSQMIGDEIDKRTHTTVKQEGKELRLVVETVVKEYETMPLHKAKEELKSSIVFYNSNLPKPLDGLIDRIEGVVKQEGIIEITAIKII